MKIIRCTQKLMKKLDVVPKENIWAKSWLESWHANVFNIEEEQCVLVTNDATLYSLFLCGVERREMQYLHSIINDYFFKLMRMDGVPQHLLEKALSIGDDVVYTPSANKSVMGSMNGIKQCIESIIYRHGGLNDGGAFKAQNLINKMPLKVMGFQPPVEAFLEKLEND